MKSDRISKTAAYIAIKFYGLTLEEPYRNLFDDQTLLFYERVVAELPDHLNTYHSLLKKKWFNKLCRFIDESLLPGDLMHILSRKFYIAKMIDSLVEKGYRQLVILGAGFDHLGATYSAQDIACVEIDTPAMSRFKQRFVRSYDYDNDNLILYPSRLSLNSGSNLSSSVKQLDSDKKTAIVAEGFFDYLSPPEAEKVLESMTTFSKDDVTLISTVFSLQELSALRSLIFKTGVKMAGEELRLHYSLTQFSDLLGKYDFAINKTFSAQLMKDNISFISEMNYSVLPGFYIQMSEFR